MFSNAYIYIGDLDSCSDEPVVYTITPSTAIAVDDEVASLTVTAPAEGEVFIRMGTWLHFGSNYIVVAKDTVITSVATAVPIKPAISAIALSDNALTWGLQIVSVSCGSLDKRIIAVNTSKLDSRGFGAIIEPASQSNQLIYTLIVKGNSYIYGCALVASLYHAQGDRAEFKVHFQGSFKKEHLFSVRYKSQQEQTEFKEVLKLAGLPVLVI